MGLLVVLLAGVLVMRRGLLVPPVAMADFLAGSPSVVLGRRFGVTEQVWIYAPEWLFEDGKTGADDAEVGLDCRPDATADKVEGLI